MDVTSILKSIMGGLLRNWMAALLVVVFSHHWISQDQQNSVTVWFNGWSNVVIDTLIAAILPSLLGVYAKIRATFKQEVARLLPAGAPQSDVKAVVKNSTFGQILTINPSPSVIRETLLS